MTAGRSIIISMPDNMNKEYTVQHRSTSSFSFWYPRRVYKGFYFFNGKDLGVLWNVYLIPSQSMHILIQSVFLSWMNSNSDNKRPLW